MLRLLVPLLLALIGTALGAGAGLMLSKGGDEHAVAVRDDGHAAPSAADGDTHGYASLAHPGADSQGLDQETAAGDVEFVKLNNQFVVPVVEDRTVAALVVLSLSLEVTLGTRAEIYQMEPKLRDAFLQVLFDHANAGGFRGQFTSSVNMDALRSALREVAMRTGGGDIHDVLIVDLVRQDS